MREDQLLGLSDVTSGQWGMFTSAQVKTLGVSVQQLARLARSGVVERLRHGVYRLGGVPDDPRTSLRAAWLALDPAKTVGERHRAPSSPAVVSHRSAAWLHGLGDLDADDLEFSVAERHQSRRREVRFHVRHLDRDEWELVDGLPVTTVLTTVRDLAQTGTDGGHLAGVVRDALVEAHADLDDVADALRPYAHHYGAPLGDGRTLVQDLLEEAGVPTSTLSTAAAVATRQAHDLDQVLASPTLAENLRLLQSPALHRNLAQLQDLVGSAAISAPVEAAARALSAQSAVPTGLSVELERVAGGALHAQTEQMAELFRSAAGSSALAAAQRAMSASLDQARDQLEAAPVWASIAQQIDEVNRAVRNAQEAAVRYDVMPATGETEADPETS